MGGNAESGASQDSGTKTVSIGSDPHADVCLQGLFPFHARISCGPSGCWVEDLTRAEAGAPQTFLAPADNPGQRIPITDRRAATYDDFLYLGLTEFSLSRLRPVEPLAITRSAAAPPEGLAEILVGGARSDRIFVDGPSVSVHHAAFYLGKTHCWVRDNHSANGTFLLDIENLAHSERISSSSWSRLSYGDVVMLGSARFPLSHLLEIKDISILPDSCAYIGRGAENDCILNHVSVSKVHARLRFENNRVRVEDLGSVGGTLLNSKRLAPYSPQTLRPGGSVSIGPYRLGIDPQSARRVRVDPSGETKLDVEGLRCDIGTRNVLRDISFSVMPGEFVGILGPSGHGKSLLLDCLVQKSRASVSGEIRINGRSLREDRTSLSEQTGYVPQGEVLPPLLTVEQVLSYAARLWIRSDLTEPEIDEQIGLVLGRLGIQGSRRQPLRVLSGGELRRVSIAYELIRSPSLLILDEPTTGLSTKDARIVIGTLRKLAEGRHTVISVVHQPSADMYASFHLVAILFGGRLLYYGRPQFSYKYFDCGEHPEHLFKILENLEFQLEQDPEQREKLLEELTARYRMSEDYREFVIGRLMGAALSTSPAGTQ
jgi:ABC-type multidrug transport system ATPase subunit